MINHVQVIYPLDSLLDELKSYQWYQFSQAKYADLDWGRRK
jgi:hypothetical protein